jgi:hypothetical protein
MGGGAGESKAIGRIASQISLSQSTLIMPITASQTQTLFRKCGKLMGIDLV